MAGTAEEPAQLERRLRLADAVGIGLGAIIGGGIFVVTGVAAGVAGPSLIVSLLLAASAATCNALSSAELAARYPESGGTYVYGYELLGPWRGFIAGWMFLASKMAAAGVVAIGLGGYASILLPGIAPRALAVSAVIAFTVLNYHGIQRTSRVNLVIVSVSVASLLVLALTTASSFRVENLQPFAPAGLAGTLEAAAILFFAYTGYARIATLGEEVRDPQRAIPRAIIITIASAALLYIGVAVVAVGAVGADALAGTPAPLAVAAAAHSSWLVTVVATGAVAAMLGVIMSQIVGMSRMALAMSRRADLPRAFTVIHPRHRVPHRAIVAVGSAAALIAATGSLQQIAAAASFAILVYYAIANWAALRLDRDVRLYHPAVPLGGLITCTMLALALDVTMIATGLAVLAVGVLGRMMVLRKRRWRTPAGGDE